MIKIKNINLAQAEAMSEAKLRLEVGKCGLWLKEQGIDPIEAADLISSLLNMGVALNKFLEDKKTNK